MTNITRAYSGDYMCRLEDHYHDSKKKFLHLHHHHDQHLSHHQHHHDKHHLHQNDHVDWCYLQCWQWSRKLPCAGINKHWRPLWVFSSVQHDDDDHNSYRRKKLLLYVGQKNVIPLLRQNLSRSSWSSHRETMGPRGWGRRRHPCLQGLLQPLGQGNTTLWSSGRWTCPQVIFLLFCTNVHWEVLFYKDWAW